MPRFLICHTFIFFRFVLASRQSHPWSRSLQGPPSCPCSVIIRSLEAASSLQGLGHLGHQGGDEEQLLYLPLFPTAGGNPSYQTNLDMIDWLIDSLFHIYSLSKIVFLTFVVQSTLNRFSMTRIPIRILKEKSTKYHDLQREMSMVCFTTTFPRIFSLTFQVLSSLNHFSLSRRPVWICVFVSASTKCE